MGGDCYEEFNEWDANGGMGGWSCDSFERWGLYVMGLYHRSFITHLFPLTCACINATDEQINTAIAQMEAVANSPLQLKMAANQMRNMSKSDIKMALDQTIAMMTGGTATAGNGSNTNVSTTGSVPPSIPREKMEAAARQMSSLSPKQHRGRQQCYVQNPARHCVVQIHTSCP